MLLLVRTGSIIIKNNNDYKWLMIEENEPLEKHQMK